MFTKPTLTITFLLAATCLIGSPALAEDPPVRVGRISYIEGTVSFHAADQNDWSYATLNYPVVAGSSFWTEPNGRSEVQVGAVEIRMDHSTEMQITHLDLNATQLEVAQGVVNIHFSTPPAGGGVEVLTPLGPIELTQPGTYHIDSGQPTVNGPAGQVQVTALEGQLEVRGPRSLLQVMPGETAVLSGSPPSFSLTEGNPTPFDDWALARERREEAHYAAQYVSPHVTGYEDLDYSGQWAADPTYGTVWYPTAVQADWAPYRYGHWAFVAPWGWTWVDDASWGFAPFHYGRWAYVGNRWGWVPGQYIERPVYAPALVAFVGGDGWNVAFTAGAAAPAIGWVPLAPYEVFYPYYATSVDYVRNVNVPNVRREQWNGITQNDMHAPHRMDFANQHGSTVVPSHIFQLGQPVHKSFTSVSGEQLAHAPISTSFTPPQPGHSAREEGRPLALPATSQVEQHPDITEHIVRPSETPQAQVPHEPQRPASPYVEAPRAPEAPQIVHPSQQPEAHYAAEPRNEEGNNIYYHAEDHSPAQRAPGPQYHNSAIPHETAEVHPVMSHEELPRAEVPHPVQQTHITPTPQGWQRAPVAHEPPPQAHEAPHPGPHEPLPR